MVGLNDVKTEAGNSIRNRTGRLNRSSDQAMKAVKEDDLDSGGGGQSDQPKRPVATLHELDQDQVEQQEHQSNHPVGGVVGDRLLLEDSSSAQSNSAEPYEKIQQPSHRTPRQHQQHPKPPHHLIPLAQRRTPRNQQQVNPEPTSPKHWNKNIEDSISGILKRLDQLTAVRENVTSGMLTCSYLLL